MKRSVWILGIFLLFTAACSDTEPQFVGTAHVLRVLEQIEQGQAAIIERLSGLETSEPPTRALSRGRPLLSNDPLILELPLGIDAPPPVPVDNPMTAAKVELGRQLFFDSRLSTDGTVSCATCPNPVMG